jgi:KTSC domain
MPSSVIAAMTYNDEARTLTIVYRGNRGVYRYFDVPPEEFAAFRAAPSKGVYLNGIFKSKQYHYERITNYQTPVTNQHSYKQNTPEKLHGKDNR